MNKGRLEALTDGIVAIAATIMVLELSVPMTSSLDGLWAERNTFLAYFISFIMIYGVWYYHHNLFERLDVITPQIFWANGLWIMILTVVPFSTAWVGAFPNDTWPEFLYALNLLLWTLSFALIMRIARKGNPRVVDSRFRKYSSAVFYISYCGCLVLSFVMPSICIYLVGFTTIVNFVWNTYRGIKTHEIQ